MAMGQMEDKSMNTNDLRLLRMMVDGNWNDKEFLIMQPGECVAPDYTGLKLKTVRKSAD